MKGEEKSRKQQRCYYGADGKIQKLPIDSGQAAAPAKESGVRVHPSPSFTSMSRRIRSASRSRRPPERSPLSLGRPDKSAWISTTISSHGDRLTVNLDSANNRLLGINIASYLEKPDDVVTLAVQFATLPDGTSYNAQTTLDAKAEEHSRCHSELRTPARRPEVKGRNHVCAFWIDCNGAS